MTEINTARTSLEDVEEALKDVIDPNLGSTWWTWAFSTDSSTRTTTAPS
jgi:hypothetical protein